MARRRSEAGDIREHLLASFAFLARSRPVASYAKGLLGSCNTAVSQLGGSKEGDWKLLMTPWSLNVRGPRYRGQEGCSEIVMGATVTAEGGVIVKQSIPISIVVRPKCFAHGPPWCKQPHDSESSTAVRRFHFDFDTSVTKWPKNHLQVGGNAGELRIVGPYHYAVAEDPSEPRVPMPSLDVVLALDLVMREFDTSLELPRESGWRKLVVRSEELWLKPYFARAHEYLQSVREAPLIDQLSQ